MRAGNMLILCLVSGVVLGLVAMIVGQQVIFGWAGLFLGAILPYSYVPTGGASVSSNSKSYFPRPIDTLARAVRAGHAFTSAIELISN